MAAASTLSTAIVKASGTSFSPFVRTRKPLVVVSAANKATSKPPSRSRLVAGLLSSAAAGGMPALVAGLAAAQLLSGPALASEVKAPAPAASSPDEPLLTAQASIGLIADAGEVLDEVVLGREIPELQEEIGALAASRPQEAQLLASAEAELQDIEAEAAALDEVAGIQDISSATGGILSQIEALKESLRGAGM